LSTILEYMNDGFKLTKALDKKWANRRFSELEPEYQNEIRQFSFNCEVFHGVSDGEILEVFARLNTYSVPLNAQELRNGKYFGFFKQSAYRLAPAYVEFWRKHKIFSERGIARMQEVELTSELLIVEIDGLQDKKKSIDRFYATLDDTFPEQKRMESRFAETMDAIEAAVGEALNDTDFT